jgi:hypothetical protein
MKVINKEKECSDSEPKGRIKIVDMEDNHVVTVVIVNRVVQCQEITFSGKIKIVLKLVEEGDFTPCKATRSSKNNSLGALSDAFADCPMAKKKL